MATGKPQTQKNGVLGRTLQELESAFADWEALDTAETAPAEAAAPENRKDTELRKKTKKLLDQLREQLAALED